MPPLCAPPQVHRDLSTNNVLLSTAAGDERGFRAMLADFGGGGSGMLPGHKGGNKQRFGFQSKQ